MDAGNTDSVKRANHLAVKHFISTVIGFAIGFGNVWRLPYLLQSHCPGSFLLPYIFVVIFYGIPLIILEIMIGNHFQDTYYNTWKRIHPAFGGIGVAICVIALVVLVNNSIMLAWLVIYLLSSFQTSLPWTHCTNLNETDCKIGGPVAFFWNKIISEISSGHIPCGTFLIVSWMLVYCVCIYRRNSESHKLSIGCFFGVGSAILFLFVIFVRSLTLDGAFDGIFLLFKPKISGIFSLQVWLDAISQLCYTYGFTFGPLISIGHICKCSRTKIYILSIFIGLWILCTSIIVSVVIYCNLGNIAWSNYQNCLSSNQSLCSLQKELDLVGDGPGTTLIAVSNISGKFGILSPVVAIVIFAIFVSVTLYTQSKIIIGIEEIVYKMDLVHKKTPFTGILCIAGWVFGTAIITLSDNKNLFLLFESASILLPLLVVVQCVAVAHFYGLKELYSDFKFISGAKQNPVLSFLWKWIIIITFSVIVVLNVPKFIMLSKSFKHSCRTQVGETADWLETTMVSIVVAAPIIFAVVYVFRLLSNPPNDNVQTPETEKDETPAIPTNIIFLNARNVNIGDNCSNIEVRNNEINSSTDNDESNDEWEMLEN